MDILLNQIKASSCFESRSCNAIGTKKEGWVRYSVLLQENVITEKHTATCFVVGVCVVVGGCV